MTRPLALPRPDRGSLSEASSSRRRGPLTTPMTDVFIRRLSSSLRMASYRTCSVRTMLMIDYLCSFGPFAVAKTTFHWYLKFRVLGKSGVMTLSHFESVMLLRVLKLSLCRCCMIDSDVGKRASCVFSTASVSACYRLSGCHAWLRTETWLNTAATVNNTTKRQQSVTQLGGNTTQSA